MRVKLNVMFLGSKSGTNDNGESYYQGQFLEKSSNQTFRVYFKDTSKLQTMTPYKDYDLDCDLYINQKGLWTIRVI